MKPLANNKPEAQLVEIHRHLSLINVAEIIILQKALEEIIGNHFEFKHLIEPAAVCSLLLNHKNIPSSYATSSRGYRKLSQEFEQHWQKDGTGQKLLDWAITKVKNLNQPRTLHQDSVLASSTLLKQNRTDSWRAIENKSHPKSDGKDIFNVLADLSLTNYVEQEVIATAHEHILSDYPEKSEQISLSDVCALVLNHEATPVIYITNTKEYNQAKTSYSSQHQAKVRNTIRKITAQVDVEGSEHSFNLNNLTKSKSKANKQNLRSWKNG